VLHVRVDRGSAARCMASDLPMMVICEIVSVQNAGSLEGDHPKVPRAPIAGREAQQSKRSDLGC
jgi:hypothetical protein